MLKLVMVFEFMVEDGDEIVILSVCCDCLKCFKFIFPVLC
ncbi:MAG: hypothetical protein CM15mP116_08830 [Synechococcus sp.]|nr:MAG: hypothetical protein CM15mP116_08830 [Synechococcus sp.]